MRLQSVLLPKENLCTVSELYFHEEGEWLNFDGYFNLFQIEKRKRYTAMEGLSLHLELFGFSEIRLMHDRTCLRTYKLETASAALQGTKQTASSDTKREGKGYDFSFPYSTTEKGVFWFALKCSQKKPITLNVSERYLKQRGEEAKENTSEFSHTDDKTQTNLLENDVYVSGWFEGEAQSIRKVNICADICTYKREDYICRNMKSLLQDVYERKDLEAARHLSVYVVDNGKTLADHKAFQALMAGPLGGKVTVYPNINAGGAGGFTRGMIEVIEHNQSSCKPQKENDSAPFTHVLLMDDDAIVEPDAFVRLYGFLTTLKDEYADITVGGTMLMEEFPQLLYASGEWFDHCAIEFRNIGLDLTVYDHCASRSQLETERETNQYSGWWYCCFPLSTVRKDNLPLPFFIHLDDIEYGIRAKNQRTVFLNGVSVWHRGLDSRLPGANIYFALRNNLVTSVLHNDGNVKTDVRRHLIKVAAGAVIRMKYRDEDLLLSAVADFLKGPEHLMRTDPEKQLQKIRKMAYQTRPLEEWRSELTPDEMDEVKEKLAAYPRALSDEGFLEKASLVKKSHRKEILLLNGWLFPCDGERVYVMSSMETPFATYRKRKVYLFEPATGKGIVLRRSYRELFRALPKAWRLLRMFDMHFDEAAKAYREAFPVLTDMEMWRRYLRLHEEV